MLLPLLLMLMMQMMLMRPLLRPLLLVTMEPQRQHLLARPAPVRP